MPAVQAGVSSTRGSIFGNLFGAANVDHGPYESRAKIPLCVNLDGLWKDANAEVSLLETQIIQMHWISISSYNIYSTSSPWEIFRPFCSRKIICYSYYFINFALFLVIEINSGIAYAVKKKVCKYKKIKK